MQQHISHIKKYDLILTTGFQNEIGIFKEFGYDRHNKNFIVSINYITLTDSGTDYVSRINVRNSTEQRIFKITEDNLNTSQYNKYLKILSELKEGLVIFNNGRYGKVSFDEIKFLSRKKNISISRHLFTKSCNCVETVWISCSIVLDLSIQSNSILEYYPTVLINISKIQMTSCVTSGIWSRVLKRKHGKWSMISGKQDIQQ